MHIRCPHCHKPIEFADDETSLSGLTCDSCGNHFGLVEEETTETYLPGHESMVGHFELLDLVGTGHFGTVWKARDSELDRIVAVKIPRKSQLDAVHTEQFMREARAAAQLRHEGIVTVHEIGRDEDCVYIVSDFVDGADLKTWIAQQRLTSRETAELVLKIAEALAHAHEEGVVHRDLKPGNIILDRAGRPHIADFGIAKRESDEITMTVEGHILGTPAYMSPEQAAGRPHDADARSDIYSLGVVLYELLTGERPFRGDSRMLLSQIIDQDPPHPRTLNNRIPRDLQTISLKCLEKNPDRRYQTADELAADLGRFLVGKPIHARPAGRMERSWRWATRNPALASASASVLLLLTMLAIGSSIAAVMIARGREEAERNADLAADSEQEARVALAREQASHERAQVYLRDARLAVDEYFVSIIDEESLDTPDLQELRRQLLEKALVYYERFIEEQAGDPEIRSEVAAAYLRMALAYQSVGLVRESVDALERGITQVEALITEGNDLAVFPSLRAGVMEVPHFRYREAVRPAEPLRVLALCEKAIRIWSKLCDENPAVPGFEQDLAGFYFQAGFVHGAMRQREPALESYTRAKEILERLVEAWPEVDRYGDQLTMAFGALGPVVASDRPHEAARIYREGIAKNPDNPFLYNRLAWMLITHSDPEVRNASEGLIAAKKAVELEPRDRNYWNSLGVAHYRNGDWRQTVTALEKSMQLQEGGDRYDWIFLAMAYSQLGDDDRARRWYSQATEVQGPFQLDFQRFKKEAQELLDRNQTEKAASLSTR